MYTLEYIYIKEAITKMEEYNCGIKEKKRIKY
jgi:hypothetical protein